MAISPESKINVTFPSKTYATVLLVFIDSK